MKKLVILILVLITTICFSENTKSVFDSKGPWTLDTTYQSEDHKIIFKGNVFKEITVDSAEHNPSDVLSASIIYYKNMTITSDTDLFTINKSAAVYSNLDSPKNITALDSSLNNVELIGIRFNSGNSAVTIPGKEYKKIKVFRVSKNKTAIQYYNMIFIFTNGTYSVEDAGSWN